jgi:DeoR family transcriptional regulator, suf operon transcriptional repressor
MTTTRDKILHIIKTRGQATVAELSSVLAISAVSVRHHLSSLQAQGLLRSTEVRRGVGRPHLVYSLTELAHERFPAKYLRLSERLLDELKTSLPPQALEEMFTRMAEGMVAEYASQLANKSLEDKMQVLMELLGAEGFMARWNRTGETISLTEYNCPYLHIGQRHPEVCSIDQTVIQHLLNANVEKTTCVLNGDEHCVFVITPRGSKTIPVDSVLGSGTSAA